MYHILIHISRGVASALRLGKTYLLFLGTIV